MDCTVYVAKTKALISYANTALLIWAFVFAYAKSRFSYDAGHFFYIFGKVNLSIFCVGKKIICYNSYQMVSCFFIHDPSFYHHFCIQTYSFTNIPKLLDNP